MGMGAFFLSMLMLVLVAAAVEEGGAADEAAAIMVPWQIEYFVTNHASGTPGGLRFEKEVGDLYAKRAMFMATNFAWRVFNQFQLPALRKPVHKIELLVEQYNDNTHHIAYVLNDSSIIHIDTNYLESYHGDLKMEFTGLVYNQVASILQWKGNGEAPAGLMTGITDYVRMKGRYEKRTWVAVRGGDRWDQGYDVTARFLGYCNELKRGFIGELNAKMKNGYTDGYFVDILGKTVDQLWSDYKTINLKGHN